MALARQNRLLFALSFAAGLVVHRGAQASDAPTSSAEAASPVTEFLPPKAISDTAVPFPIGAPEITQPVTVQVKLLVAETGLVAQVQLASKSQPPFDDAVIRAAEHFIFEPALFNGKPTAVSIAFSQTFSPTPMSAKGLDEIAPNQDGSTQPQDLLEIAVLSGQLLEMGTRETILGGKVTLKIGEQFFTADTDLDGRFRMEVPPGSARVTISAANYEVFYQAEELVSGHEIAVAYYLDPNRDDPYETIVYGKEHRDEVSRISLRGAELTQIPGTFGDPFRVVQSLPGVAAISSVIPFPIVRGTSPSSTGFLVDGTRLPLLFHMLSGPSVIHPEFIDEIQFYPGSAPVIYGGYSGGVVDGRTRPAGADEKLIDGDISLLLAGALIRRPIKTINSTVTLAGRYGYPGLMLALATKATSLSYWDYQFRLDGGTAGDRWTLFAYGARDILKEREEPTFDNPSPPLEDKLILGFHRLDLRYSHFSGKLESSFRLVAGVDKSFTAGDDGASVSTRVFEPTLRWTYRARRSLSVIAGMEWMLHDTDQGRVFRSMDNESSDSNPNKFSLQSITNDIDRLYLSSALTEAIWRPTARWLFRPGIRLDLFDDAKTTQVSVDPRLSVRYLLMKKNVQAAPESAGETGIWLKGGIGTYHQPPRFVVPTPGLDTMPLKYGLPRSLQTSFGLEIPFQNQIELTMEAYYSDMDPTIFDLSVNDEDLAVATDGVLPRPDTGTDDYEPSDSEKVLKRLTQPQRGRAYGLEFMLRRKSTSGVHGWFSYTASRAERIRKGSWVPYDFDRTHLVNLVAGIPLPRHWELGMRVQYQSGKPMPRRGDYNAARTNGYARIDFRIDKHARWRSWILDFYVDVMNVALLPEEVNPGNTLRYVLPTVGVRGRY